MDIIQQAIDIIRDGGIVIYPTDTAFAIGCRVDRPRSVDRLYRIRGRSRRKAAPVLVSSHEMARGYYSSPSEIVRRLMDRYWPGALTIVAPCRKDLVYSPIRGGGDTIGLRMPDHDVARTLIAAVGVPILGPSANFHGKPTPFRLEDLDDELVKLVDAVVPGTCRFGVVSTVIDCTTSPPTILRRGAIDLKSQDLRA